MKVLLIGIIVLMSASVSAMTEKAMELTMFATEAVNVSVAKKNPDNSVTFSDIKVLRGDQSFEIDATVTSNDSVCKMLGYEKSLTGANLNTTSYNSSAYWTLVSLNSNGQYSNTIRSDKKIAKLTCYNQEALKAVFEFNKSENPDGSATLTKFTYFRGDQSFEIDATVTSFDSICKMSGYENSLTGANLNLTSYNSSAYWTLVSLNSTGQYIDTIRSDKKITKATCFSGQEPELVVVVEGERYRRINP
jgi:hypothetical protein